VVLVKKSHLQIIGKIINELDTDTLVDFLSMIIETKNAKTIIYTIQIIEKRDSIFSPTHKSKLANIYDSLFKILLYRVDLIEYVYKFPIIFNLHKSAIPQGINELTKDIFSNKRYDNVLSNALLDLIQSFYVRMNIPFPIHEGETWVILLNKNNIIYNYSIVLQFEKYFFNIKDSYKQEEILKMIITKGEYLTAFCLSLIHNKKERDNYIMSCDIFYKLGAKIFQMITVTKDKAQKVNQDIVKNVISKYIKNKPRPKIYPNNHIVFSKVYFVTDKYYYVTNKSPFLFGILPKSLITDKINKGDELAVKVQNNSTYPVLMSYVSKVISKSLK
jgi:hypothetical protein